VTCDDDDEKDHYEGYDKLCIDGVGDDGYILLFFISVVIR